MIFRENHLLADDSHLMKYHTLFFSKIRKDVAKEPGMILALFF